MITDNGMQKTYTCSNCEKEKTAGHFLKAGRHKAGMYHVCKTCIEVKVNSNEDYAKLVLHNMDMPFIKRLWIDVKKNKNVRNKFSAYLTKITSDIKYENLTYRDSIFDGRDIGEIKEEVTFNERWRGSFTFQDIEYLEKYYR